LDRQLALRGRPWSPQERSALLEYCEADVKALEQLFRRMKDRIPNTAQALLRGRYTIATARMEATGIPVDIDLVTLLKESSENLKIELIEPLRCCVFAQPYR
jgi:hypothetical protein